MASGTSERRGTGGGATQRTVSLRLPEADYTALRMVAAAKGQSMSRFLEEVVRFRLRGDLAEVAAAVDSARSQLDDLGVDDPPPPRPAS